jgi:NADPH2:quinone reductase
MRAVVVSDTGGPEKLVVQELEEPEAGEGEVSIDVAFAGVGFVDTLFRSGALPLKTPFVPGIEVTGQVRAVGANVSGFDVGQPVAALLNDFGRTQRAGGYAQVAIAHQAMTTVLGTDTDLPVVTGALINGVTAWLALHDSAVVSPADTVVVLGASGGLGGITARLAAMVPCRRVVAVVSRDPARAPVQCTDVVLTDDLEQWLGDSGNVVDVVIDPVGGRLRRLLFDHLASFGRHVVLGNASGEDIMFSSDSTWHGTRTLTGLSLGAIAHLRPETIKAALTAVVALVDRGLLAEPAPDVQPLSQVRHVHRAFDNRSAPAKTVLDVSR